MIVPLTAGSPRSAGIWPTVIVTARPMTKPVTTDAARNCDRKPRRAAPATTRIAPTMSASAAVSVTNVAGSCEAPIAATTDADRIATDELAVTLRWRDVPKIA